ncbi:MAG: hypothetical protein Satyrvirus9_3 [Satyrvirus sp.]|uniref:Uncharacterized protein n=1 Tax=Satyrvirus sp. TaxID=2487771 RepID=A0A3G5ADN2_9VIRU|nr:MAG: hypothetical protein Satyrvirus9_3 [Satyrvirus sp.]
MKMIKYQLLSCILFLSISGSIAYPMLEINNKISNDFYEICKIVSIERNISLPYSNSNLYVWNDWVQNYFLREKNKDHWDIINYPKYSSHKQLQPLFEKLGLTEEYFPISKYYDYMVIFSGTPWDLIERIQYVNYLWRSGIRATVLIHLGGLRKLHANELAFLNYNKSFPIYEHEMAKIIWNQTIDDTNLRTMLIDLIVGPRAEDCIRNPQSRTAPPGPPDSSRRANTEDTLISFFGTYNNGSSYLFVSNAPYGPYQAETVKKVAKELYIGTKKIEVVSSRIYRDIPTIIYLDTLARRLFTIVQTKNLYRPILLPLYDIM